MTKNNIKNPKITPELGADKDGMQKGGVVIQATDPFTSTVCDSFGIVVSITIPPFCMPSLSAPNSGVIFGSFTLFF